MRTLGIAVAALALATLTLPASAETVRFGKGHPTAFTFLPVDIGVEYGIFKKHGVDLEVFSFEGATKIHQAFAAGSLDMGAASGPDMVFVAKGSPVKAVANMAGPPLLIGIGVAPDSNIKKVADLKGKKIAVTTLGSLTYWLPRELARLQGWGTGGIETVQVNSTPGMVAALKTKQVDAMSTGVDSIYALEEKGEGKLLLNFGDYIKDFMMHVIYATDKYMASNPDAVRKTLAAWFDVIAYMQAHKAETVKTYVRVSKLPESIARRTYDDVMPIFTRDGHFVDSQLKVLAKSFVDLKQVDAEPDMRKLLTEQFLPKRSGS
jgi:ABC-type nitrate/sulfonate/bicarbonate transport system substrate-binding protein